MARNGVLGIRSAMVREGWMGMVVGVLLWLFKTDLSNLTSVGEVPFATAAILTFVWGFSKFVMFKFHN